MKRRAALMLALLAMLMLTLMPAGRVWAEEELYVLDTGGSALLAAADGRIVIPAGVYSSIGALNAGGCYAARAVGGGGLALLGPDGAAVTDFLYDALSGDGENVLFTRDGLCGVMDVSGGVLLEPVWNRLVSMGGGRYLALRGDPLDDTPDLLYAVSEGGSGENTGIRLAYGPFEASEGLSAAVSAGGGFGYLSDEGTWALEPEFLWAGQFEHGRALVVSEAGMGCVDRDGQWIVGPVRGRVSLDGGGQRALAVLDGGGAALFSPETGREIARFEGVEDACFMGRQVCLRLSGGGFRLTDDARTVYETDADVVWFSALGPLGIERRAFSEERACALVRLETGEVLGRWQELTFAGMYDGAVCCLFSEYETTETEAGGLIFHDEVIGTRRWGLIDEAGETAAAGFLSLRQTGRALLTAEAEDWVSLIRPDGTIIARLEKAE